MTMGMMMPTAKNASSTTVITGLPTFPKPIRVERPPLPPMVA